MLHNFWNCNRYPNRNWNHPENGNDTISINWSRDL